GLLFVAYVSNAQISAQGSVAQEYSVDTGDDYYIFCAPSRDDAFGRGTLVASTPFPDNSVFTWEKYDTISGAFIFFQNGGINDTLESRISGLDDGCYRVSIESGGMISEPYQAWVLHNWIEVTYTEIPDSTSNCEQFQILADFEYAPLFIFNTANNSRFSVRNSNVDFVKQWSQGSDEVRRALSPIIYDPIASETPVEYSLTITDEFGCSGSGVVDYISKVTKADFFPDPTEGEAVLEVTFMNNSINYDSIMLFFYKDPFLLSQENNKEGEEVDSIDFIIPALKDEFEYDPQYIHEFEYSGEYRVKLVTIKVNETGNCYDTIYSPAITVRNHLIDIPNVFTPNGDGTNDVFVIRTESMKSMNFKIYNRWGGLVHSWKYSNIKSNDYTFVHSVWDGTIGNRLASPGVYYYVVTYEGRDVYQNNLDENGEERKIGNRTGKTVKETKTGFLHLFRGKQ
ncbi:MAG: gliding motility-associated C-terminal domain-containing protein, partial [Prolixibacteraceae bacterium]|nr:gliding motility-associated C-terminal domain-containing protein [Prolixibacteraceae bacterium]